MKNQRGFTFIELLIYISLVSVFLVGAIRFSWDVIYSREKAFAQRIVTQNASTVMARIAYEIQRAQSITSLTPTQLVLNSGGPTTTINLSGTTLQISPNGTGPYSLISNQARVTNLTFTNLSSTDLNTRSVGVSLTVEQLPTGTSGQFTASETLTENVELNTGFNQARNLLVDFLYLSVSANGRNIEGITLQNASNSAITIDQIFISWTGTAGGENITNFQIELAPEEWTGTAGTGSTLNITDYTLAPNSNNFLSYISFSQKMWLGQFNLNFIMADGSIHKTYFTLPAAPSVPSPTPTPVNTCATYCDSLPAYITGTCRANPSACTAQGETYESGGNVYCTGGPSADTCCCKP